MKRPGSVDRQLARIKQWREICPDLTLRSTFIVGFPGETEEDFQMLLDFLKEARLDRVGCFKYSPVEGATANELADQVPEEVKEERWNRFMQLQQQISAERLQEKVGREILVIIDEVDEEGAIGRSMADAPEIDGAVYLNGETSVKPGDIVRVKVENADEYDLWEPGFNGVLPFPSPSPAGRGDADFPFIGQRAGVRETHQRYIPMKFPLLFVLLALFQPAFAAAIPVRVAVVEQTTHAAERHVPGRIEAIHSVEIKARTEGVITQVHFRDGQYVKKGRRAV